MPDKKQLVFEVKAQTNQAKTEVKKFGKGIDDVKRKSDKAGKSFGRLRVKTEGLRRTLGVVRNNLLLVTFAMGGTVAIMKKAIDAFARQELAEKKLSSALGKTSQELLDQASALQKITSFGDEAVIEVQALIAAFTDDEEQIKSLTTATLDLAAAKGMDLKAAADMVAKSFGSSTNALSRYGIQTEGVAGSQERLTMLVENTAKLFGGQAVAQAETMTGAMAQMSNALGDTSETMGNMMQPAVISFSRFIKEAAEEASEFFRTLSETTLETAVRQLRELGAAAKDIRLLENLVDMEFVSDALLNNNKEIEEIFGRNNNLSKETLAAFGAIVSVQKEQNANAGQLSSTHETITSDIDAQALKSEKVRSILADMIDKTVAIGKGQEDLTHEQERQISLNTIQIEQVGEILKLVLGREAAERRLAELREERVHEDVEATIISESKLRKGRKEDLDIQFKRIEGGSKLDEIDQKAKKSKEALTKTLQANAQAAINQGMAYTNTGRAAQDAAEQAIIAEAQKAVAAFIATSIVQFGPVVGAILAATAGATVGSLMKGAIGEMKTIGAETGYDGIVNKPTIFMTGENNKAEQVSITPLEGPNINGPQGGSITVNVSGNVMTQDFVEGDLAEAIRQAARRGTDFGVS